MSSEYQYPKHEKEEEKELGKDEKEEEKTLEKEDEKTWEEKWRRDPLSAAVWAIILIWAGLVLLAETMGLLGNLTVGDRPVTAWSIVFIGAGLIVAVEVVIRLLVPSYRRATMGYLILAAFLVGIGLSALGYNVVWPLLLIGLGLAFLLRGFGPRS